MSQFSLGKYLTLGRTVKRDGGLLSRWLRVTVGRFRPRTEMYSGSRLTPEYMDDLKGSGRSLDTRDLGLDTKKRLK